MTISKRSRILVISPHPDDEAIGCGGLIMTARKRQASVHVLYVSVGSSRQFLTGSTHAKDRLPEIRQAAEFGGFTYAIAFNGDEFMRVDSIPQKTLIEILEDEMGKFKPDTVLLPYRHSFDQDHRAIATAALTALRPLPPKLHHQPSTVLEYEEPYTWTTGDILHVNTHLDITDVFEEKLTLLACHASQLRTDPFPRSPENLRRLAGIRGTEIGVPYAESYRLLKLRVV